MTNFAVQLIGGFGSTVTYYFTYFVQDLDVMALVQTAAIVALASLLVMVPLANKFGRTNVMRRAFVLCAVGCVLRASSTSVPVMYIGALLASIVTYAVLSFQGLMLIDCMDYGDWKSGKRIEGAIFAATGLGTTLGGGVGQAACGFALKVFGFDGMAAVQTETAMAGIRFCYGWLPAIIIILILVVLMTYDLDKKMPQIHKELDERNGQSVGNG